MFKEKLIFMFIIHIFITRNFNITKEIVNLPL